MHAITLSNARRNFDALFERALSDRAPIAIVRHRGEGAVIIAESEWELIEAKIGTTDARQPTDAELTVPFAL